MKLFKSIISETKTTGRCLVKKLLTILICALLSGGANYSFAENITFKAVVTKEGSALRTNLTIIADSLEAARDEITLNGWKVISLDPVGMKIADDEKSAVNSNIDLNSDGDKKTDTDKDSNSDITKDQKGKTTPDDEPAAVNKDKSTVVQDFDERKYKQLLVFYFNNGKYETQPTDDQKLLISTLDNSKKYFIAGHTDSLKVFNAKEYQDNFELSNKRADYIKYLLVAYGIPEENIDARGYNNLFPAKKTDNDKGEPINRRAVLYEQR